MNDYQPPPPPNDPDVAGIKRRSERPPEVAVIRVVRVTFLRGVGEFPDPVREVTRYYDDIDGRLLAEVDPAG